MKRYDKLFERIQIGKLKLKNRIVMSPMHTKFMEGTAERPRFSHWYTEYFRERARGGVGLIITGHLKSERNIDPYPIKSMFPVIDREEKIKEFDYLTETVHRYGAKIAAQLSAGTGRLADVSFGEKWPGAPSEIVSFLFPNIMTRELKKSEIYELVDAYGKAADRIRRAGFDALYIHALAYIIDQFISSCWNRRTDEYGGSLKNRLRFLKECLESARRYIGDLPVIVGLALDHGFDRGRKIKETIAIAKEIEKLEIDAFHLRNGSYDSIGHLIPNAHYPEGAVLENAIKFKMEIKTPIIVDGGFSDPFLCANAIEEKKTDLIGLGRALLADPEWPKKVESKRIKEIRPCIKCMECFDRIRSSKYIGCSVNARLGHERSFQISSPNTFRKVLVVGGGPAGMEAARIAASRGHRVILAEKKDKLGGRLVEGAAIPYKYLIGKFDLWLQNELKKFNVEIMLGKEADEDLVRKIEPDVLIIATGAKAVIPEIGSIERKNVKLVEDVLRQKTAVGDKVVVIGGGPVGCDTACALAEKGKNVTIVEQLPELIRGVSVFNKPSIMEALSFFGVSIRLNTIVKEVRENGVLVENGDRSFIEADTIVISAGYIRDDSCYEKLKSLSKRIYQIGDCVDTRNIYDAIQEGYIIGQEI